jgi:hypothetical protein
MIKRRDEIYFAVANMCPATRKLSRRKGRPQRLAFSFARLSPTVTERNADIVPRGEVARPTSSGRAAKALTRHPFRAPDLSSAT